MISTVNKKIIEMILNREMEFDDFNFKPDTWDDTFIVELLDWYDNHIKSNCLDKDQTNWIKLLSSHYEQVVRILYYFVIYMNVKDTTQLRKVFKYLFIVDKSHSYPYIISEGELIEIYIYIKQSIPNLNKNNKKREYIDKLIGIWNTEERNNKFKCIGVATTKDDNRIIDIFDESYKENSLNENTENDKILLKILKETFSENDLKKIVEFYKTHLK